MSFESVSIAAIPFAVTSLGDASDWLVDQGRSPQRSSVPVRLANAYSIAAAKREPSYFELFQGPGVTLPDGLPVVWLMRALRGRGAAPRSEQVRGSDLFLTVIDRGRTHGLRHFFLGTSPETLRAMLSSLSENYRGLSIAGAYAPPFAPVDGEFIDGCLVAIGDSRPDLLWIALGTPKQDYAAALLARELNIPVIAVGAAFDFVAGSMPEAPRWMRKSGLEWLFRLGTEPRRLWRRYFFGNASFALTAFRELMGKREQGR